MKKPVLIFLLFTLLLFSMDASARRIKGRSSSYQDLKLVADLPDTEAYQIPVQAGWKENHYMDLATLTVEYGLNKSFPLWVKEDPILVGFDKLTGMYYVLPDAELDKIIKDNNLDKKKLLRLNLYRKHGGKIVLGLLIALAIWGWWPSGKKSKKITPKHI